MEHSGIGIYVHIPFCRSRCVYCDFCSSTAKDLVDKFVVRVVEEIMSSERCRVKTIYFGGGTPSVIGVDNLRRIIESVREKFDVSNVEEFTIECNPDDVNKELVEMMIGCGVNRVSIGVQSLNDKMLRFLSRRHNSNQVYEAVEIIRKCGIENISIDMIFGLPELSEYVFERDLRRFVEMGVNHLSTYALMCCEGTPLSRMLESGRVKLISDDRVAEQNELINKYMAEYGYEHYEISNYARSGYRSRHNSSYWKRVPYIGFGPSASSFDGRCRSTNVADVEVYCEGRIEKEVEMLGSREVFEEKIMLGLRTADGVDICECDEEVKSRFLRELEIGNLQKIGNDIYRIREDRWFVSNDIICRLI